MIFASNYFYLILFLSDWIMQMGNLPLVHIHFNLHEGKIQ